MNPFIQQSINPICMLALTLLVAGVGADHTDNAFAANNFAILAKLLNGRANFHIDNFSSGAGRAADGEPYPATLTAFPTGCGLATGRKATTPGLPWFQAAARQT
jgi:hypothetical protein